MNEFSFLALAFGLGLLGFVEPCSIGANGIFLGYLQKKERTARDQMIMHHQGAIMSSEHMISDSKRPELRKLADSIEKSQSEQIDQMQAWRKQWYPDAERTFGMMDSTQTEEMMGSGQMDNMMGGSMQEMMGADATDEMFLRMMIPHHQMAVDMSDKALKEAEHPRLKDLMQKIGDEQSAEIELMKGYLDGIESAGEE